MYISLSLIVLEQKSHDSEIWITSLRFLKCHFKKTRKSHFLDLKKIKNTFSNCGYHPCSVGGIVFSSVRSFVCHTITPEPLSPMHTADADATKLFCRVGVGGVNTIRN